MAVPSTPGSNVTNYPQHPVDCVRAGATIVPISVLMGATGVPSVVSCPIAISCASAAAGILAFTVPSGLAIELMGAPAHSPATLGASLATWQLTAKSLTSGTFSLVHYKENATGTAVSGVNPASGDRVTFFLYIHSQNDGGAL